MTRPPLASDRLFTHRSITSGSLASLTRTGLEKLFHSWRGASGRRYICSVYPLGEAPVFDCARAVIAAVRRDAAGAKILFAFQPGPAEMQGDFRLWTQRARAKGAGEWHVHLLAETPEERAEIARDLAPPQRFSA
jgi:hypothetical protein